MILCYTIENRAAAGDFYYVTRKIRATAGMVRAVLLQI
jgi:hypothetical protein